MEFCADPGALPHSTCCFLRLLAAGCLAATSALAAEGTAPASPPVSPPCQETIPELYQRVSRAVVSITATSIDPYDAFDRMVRQMGSGFVVDPSGLVLTNSHVVFGQQIITVTLDDGSSHLAKIVGADPVLDVAILRLEPPATGPLPAVKLGDSAHLLVGEDVFAIGNLFGLDQTLTRGVVSADLKGLLRTPLADGFLVEVVEPRSPAGEAGIRGGNLDLMIGGQPVLVGGDVITEMNSVPVKDGASLARAIATLKVGEKVRLTFVREEKARQAEMVVVERPLLPGDVSPRRSVAPVGSGPTQPPPRPVTTPRRAF